MIIPWDTSYALEIIPRLVQGLQMTIWATFLGSIGTFVLGFIWFMLRLANIPVISPVANFIVHFLRGTPLLIQLYFVFYVFPSYGLLLDALTCGVITLTIFNSAPMSEVYRAGIEAVAKGQWEACQTLGIPVRQVWSRFILPQAVRTVLPMMGNMTILMFKETALLSTITVHEMMSEALQLSATSFRYIEPLTIAGAFYFAISYTSAKGVRMLEKRIKLDG